jgi:hypothetical protein
MALQLLSEADFIQQLTSRGFVKTNVAENNVEVWMLNGKPFTVPLPVHDDGNYKLYDPFALPLFFQHALGADACVVKNGHSDRSYEVIPDGDE